MDSFLMEFFPSVYHKEKMDKGTNQYCKFDSQLLTAFTSSLYLAALIASFFAATVTRVLGRKWSMFGGGITFLAGAALNGAAQNVSMLIIGRILLGVGVGFANQVYFFNSDTRIYIFCMYHHSFMARVCVCAHVHSLCPCICQRWLPLASVACSTSVSS